MQNKYLELRKLKKIIRSFRLWQFIFFIGLFIGYLMNLYLDARASTPPHLGETIAKSFNRTVSDFWKKEYDRLYKRISNAGRNSVPIFKNGKPILEGRPGFPYLDNHCLIWDSDRDPADVVLRRTRALLNHLKTKNRNGLLESMNQILVDLEKKEQHILINSPERKTLFTEVCKLRRSIAMVNPLLDFNEIIFVACGTGIGIATDTTLGLRGSHWQYMGFQSNEVKGEGLIVLSDWKTKKPTIRHLLNPTQREKLRFHSAFDLSYDGREILFAAQTFSNEDVPWDKELSRLYDLGDGPTHVFKMDLTGSDPEKLTQIGYNNGFASWLPNGRIIYISDYVPIGDGSGWHRKEDRCGGWGTQLWSMKADGSDAYPISWHETAEYHPVVDHDGRIVYSRWDYLDRNWDAAHHLWTCYPDGRDPRSPHGNYPYPHHNLEEGSGNPNSGDGRAERPWSEIQIRPVPGAPGKYTAIAGGHHRVVPGVPILINTNIEDDNKMSQVKIITGSDLPHEGWGVTPYVPQDEYYSPWPLNEDFYLMTTRENILLVDKFGNEILIYRWEKPYDKGYPLSPRPYGEREKPVTLPTLTFQGERSGIAEHKRATIFVADVYNSIDAWPEGTEIKSLRILQYIPKTFKFHASHVQKRVILGTVPVEPDGSAYFEAPVERLIYFQALDEEGLAIQSMRSGTYVHPGEQLTCLGCHENRTMAPSNQAQVALALKRPPSKIIPEIEGSNPLSFKKLVYNNVFQKTCLNCHTKEGKGLQDFSFDGIDEWDYIEKPSGPLAGYLWRSRARDGYDDEPHGAHRYVPGRFGARESKLGKLMLTTHRDRVSDEEFYRVMLWLDANSVYSSAYMEGRKNPLLEYDPKNKTGVEANRPAP
jgi:hypothetical protein